MRVCEHPVRVREHWSDGTRTNSGPEERRITCESNGPPILETHENNWWPRGQALELGVIVALAGKIDHRNDRIDVPNLP